MSAPSDSKSTKKAQRLSEDLNRLIDELERAGAAAADLGFGGVGVHICAAIDNARDAERITTSIVKRRREVEEG